MQNGMYAQETSTDNLISGYKEFFTSPQDVIYLNLNKDIFISGEEIYFSVYIFNQQKGIPAEVTANLHVGLYDQEGKQLQHTLWEVIDGIAFGQFKTDASYEHGFYYIKAATKQAKDSEEKHHTIQKIQILQYEEFEKEDNLNEFQVRIEPEGGQLISGILNTIGFEVSNGLGSPIRIEDGQVMNSAGEVVLENLKSNEFGIGRFDIIINSNEEYTCKLRTTSGHFLYVKLPMAIDEGFALNVTGNDKKRIINVRTNPLTYEKVRKKKYVLVIHRNGELQHYNFTMDKKHKSFALSKEQLLEGVNIISLLDHEMKLLSERVIYNSKPPEDSDLNIGLIGCKETRDSLCLTIRPQKKLKESLALSISVVAEESLVYERKKTMYEALMIQPYLDVKAGLYPLSFKKRDQKSFANADLFMMIHGKSNFSWEDLKSGPNAPLAVNESGITVKGLIKHKNLEKVKTLIMYQEGIDGMNSVAIENDGSFTISNANLNKESPVHFTLLNHKGRMEKPDLQVEFLPKIISDSIDPFSFEIKEVYDEPARETTVDLSRWMEEKRTALEEVILKAKAPEVEAERNNKLIGGFWNSEKITEEHLKKNRTLSTYLRRLGFKVGIDPVNGSVFVAAKQAINPVIRPPVIYLNGFRLFEPLRDYPLHSIDEVYYEHAGLMESNGGTIFIYLREGRAVGLEPKSHFTSIMAENGFNIPAEFICRIEAEDMDILFKKYGAIYWEPKALSDQNKEIHLPFLHLGLKRFKVFIEGFSSDGTLFSEHKVISLMDN